MVIKSERIFEDPQSVLKEIFKFLEVDPDITIDVSPKNVSSKKKKVGEHLYNYLDEYFEPYNQALREELGSGFTWD